jgi:hypothetical protein
MLTPPDTTKTGAFCLSGRYKLPRKIVPSNVGNSTLLGAIVGSSLEQVAYDQHRIVAIAVDELFM